MKLPDISNLFAGFGGRALKYGYSNARVKGMKGLLLKDNELDELIKVKSIDAVIELLQRTHYRDELAQLSLMYRGSTLVELAAGRHYAKVARKIIKMSPNGDRKLVDALLKRWDILNLKTVISARRLGKKFEELQPYLVPVGSLKLQELERIAKADERNMFEEIRRSDFGKEMFAESTTLFNVESFNLFKTAIKNMDSMLQLQALLDAYAYAYVENNLVSSSKDIQNIKVLFRKEIDAKNVAIVERVKARGVAKEKIKNYLIKGGSLNDATLRSLMDAKDFDSVLAIAKKKLPGLEKQEGAIKTLSDLEIALEKAIAQEKLHTFYRSVLSIGILLGFLLLKEEELNNLRKIAKGKEFNIPEEKLRETLVIV